MYLESKDLKKNAGISLRMRTEILKKIIQYFVILDFLPIPTNILILEFFSIFNILVGIGKNIGFSKIANKYIGFSK